IPVAAQRASMPEVFCADGDFNVVMICLGEAIFASLSILRQVAAHQKRIQLFPTTLLVVTLATADDRKSGAFVKTSRRLIVLLDLEKDRAHATACEMAEMGEQEIARQAAAAIAVVDRDREDLRFVRRHPRHREADRPSPHAQAMNERVALGEHAL